MPKIDLSVQIKKDKKDVYQVLKRMDRFAEFVSGIKHVRLTKKKADSVLAEWNISIDGASIMWTEETTFFDKAMEIRFKMVEGDYTKYKGKWILKKAPRGTNLQLAVDIDWGAPELMRFVGPIIEKKTRRAFRALLLGIKKEAEKK
ncbi:MAG: SRPBCC family protein [Candidatus Omnitrophota bacterium]